MSLNVIIRECWQPNNLNDHGLKLLGFYYSIYSPKLFKAFNDRLIKYPRHVLYTRYVKKLNYEKLTNRSFDLYFMSVSVFQMLVEERLRGLLLAGTLHQVLTG